MPDDWFMNVAFNYIKFASYSALPFVVVLALNVAVIWRTVRVSPNLRRSAGGGDGVVRLLRQTDNDRQRSTSGDRLGHTAATFVGRDSSRLSAAAASASLSPSHQASCTGSGITASQVRHVVTTPVNLNYIDFRYCVMPWSQKWTSDAN